MVAREDGLTNRLALSLSLSLSLASACNPYCERIPLAQDNTSHIFPLVFHLAPTHLGWDTQRQFYSSVQGPPGVETPTCSVSPFRPNPMQQHIHPRNQQPVTYPLLSYPLQTCH
jgi:hypothetical protein